MPDDPVPDFDVLVRQKTCETAYPFAQLLVGEAPAAVDDCDAPAITGDAVREDIRQCDQGRRVIKAGELIIGIL